MFLHRSARGASEDLSSNRKGVAKVAMGLAVAMAMPVLMPSGLVAAPADAAAGNRETAVGDAAREQYFIGREYYLRGDWVNARRAMTAAKNAGYVAAADQMSCDWYLNKMTAKDQSDLAKAREAADLAQAEAQAAKIKAAQAKADADAMAAREAAKASAEARTTQAAAEYKKAVSAYSNGDWVAARTSFVVAKELGYQPNWLETPIDEYLKNMDEKGSAQAAKRAADLAARRELAAQAKHAADAESARLAGEPMRLAQDAPMEPAPTTPTTQPAEPPAPATPAPAAETPAPAPAATPTVETPAPAPTPAPGPTVNTAALAQARQAARQAEGRQLYAQAQAAQAAGNNAKAVELTNQALAQDPDNADAKALQAQLTTQGNLGADTGGSMRNVAAGVTARRGEIIYNFTQALDQARAATDKKDFGTARTSITAAKVARESARQDFTAAEQTNMDTQIAQAQIYLDQALAAENQRVIEEGAQNTAQAERLKAERAQAEREQTVKALTKNATELTRQQKYNEALGVINQILVIDPTNDYANGAKPLVQDKAAFKEQREYREAHDYQYTKQLNRAEESKIPYDEILRYPSDWPDLSARRDQTNAQERNETAMDRAMVATLDRRLPELRFDNVGFSDVIDFLRDVTGANIFVNWKSLEAAGVDRNAPVTARLRDIPFRKALTIILDSVGGQTKLGYTVDEGVITISTGEDLNKNVVTLTYDIRDLIIDIPDFTDAPSFSLDSTASGGSGGGGGGRGGGGGGGGSGGGLFGGSGGSGGSGGKETTGKDRQQLIDDIIKLITTTVSPETWRDAGGTVGAISQLNGQLIVTQTPENQRLLNNLLEKLRETRAIQVNIEARFLTIQRNFLEDIGMDIDATFNLNGAWSDKFSPITVTQDSSTFTAGPTTGVPGSIASASVFAGGGSGMSIAGSFLDDFQVNFLLKATQASQDQTVLTAPRVTLFNGQRAYVLVATQRAYVSDLTPVVGTAAVAFDPTIDIVESGVLLDVQATVSSDRKYVTLTLRPQLAQLLDLFQFAFTTQTTQTASDNGNLNTGAGTGLVQQPELQITEVRTSVSVPDGGTLLLGGQTLAAEIEKESGVPILSKIPVLKRLFTNRSMAKDEQILLILVKPTIIIQKESEQKQFPLLSSKVAG